MSSEIYIVPRLLVDWPAMPELIQVACAEADAANRGLTVPQFLSELSDDQLKELLMILLDAQKDPSLATAVSIFCAMMAVSEGMVVAETQNLTPFMTRLGLMTQAELLTRQGLLRLDPATLTLEAFDILAVPRTELGKQRISEIKVLRIPPP